MVPEQTPKSNEFAAINLRFRRYILMISLLALMISPQIDLCFRRYFHTFPCVISVLVTCYDFAANKLMFSQLFPYSLLFNLSTGYILTISRFILVLNNT